MEDVKNSILIFMAHNEMKPNMTNFRKLLKETNPLEAFTNICRGDLQLALMEFLEGTQSKSSILKEIEKLEEKRNCFMKKPRVNSGSYSQTLDNYSRKLNRLKDKLSVLE